MGISIRAADGRGPSFDLTCSGFWRFRSKVAELAGPAVHEPYQELPRVLNQSAEDIERYDVETERLVATRRVPAKLMDFLYKPDAGGHITALGCKTVLKTIGDYEDSDRETFSYVAYRPVLFRDLKGLLQYCAENGVKLEWY